MADPIRGDRSHPSDDVRVIDIDIPSDVNYIGQVIDLVRAECGRMAFTHRQLALNGPVALAEALSNAILRVKIPLPTKTIEVFGKVVRANPFPQGVNKRTYVSGFAFTKISEADRELMIKFIFEKMREDLKQGKTV